MKKSDFIPPVLFKVLNKFRRGRQNETPLKSEGMKVYESYQTALAACGAGYQDDAIIDVVFEKTRILKKSLERSPAVIDFADLRPLTALSLCRKADAINVLDFGGACGAHYFVVSAFFGRMGIKLRWNVVETPKMAAKASELADGNLKFFDDMTTAKNDLGDIHLIYSSGTFQYLSDPIGTFKRLLLLGADSIFLTRVVLLCGEREFVVVQESRLGDNGPGPMPEGFSDRTVAYPLSLIPKRRFEEIIHSNYSIALVLRESRNVLRVGTEQIDMFGYFARRNPES